MRDYVIMTDSCCDLSAEEVAESGVVVIPLTFTMEGVNRRDTPDHADMSLEAYYKKIREGVLSTTSAVSVGDFVDAMRPIVESGKDILCINFSSALSTTYQSAVIAAEELKFENPEGKIVVIDSLAASRGQGMLVWYAAKKKKEGMNIDDLADWVREMAPHQDHWFTVADLNHLRRGGRLNATSAVVGTVLSIKPVMHCDAEGKLTPVSKARGMKQALTELVNKMDELGTRPLEDQTVFICHADAPESVEYVKGLLKERFGVTDVRAGYIGPVIGSHTGAGTLGLFFFGKER
ncbi:MAG: DegV family protein [Ruminococcaceae bacterium]|jgi:DegV family protein with EDD domain|nr:DegV family protein [Oscillospiraceae bacterium]